MERLDNIVSNLTHQESLILIEKLRKNLPTVASLEEVKMRIREIVSHKFHSQLYRITFFKEHYPHMAHRIDFEGASGGFGHTVVSEFQKYDENRIRGLYAKLLSQSGEYL